MLINFKRHFNVNDDINYLINYILYKECLNIHTNNLNKNLLVGVNFIYLFNAILSNLIFTICINILLEKALSYLSIPYLPFTLKNIASTYAYFTLFSYNIDGLLSLVSDCVWYYSVKTHIQL